MLTWKNENSGTFFITCKLAKSLEAVYLCGMQQHFDLFSEVHSPNQFICDLGKGVRLYIKREDLLHPEVSGNKFRKLKYNLKEAKDLGHTKVLTFGGAFSNHIAATAAAAKLSGLPSVGVIRGEELGRDREKTLASNSTLNFAASCGMELHFVSREEYRKKNHPNFAEDLHERFGEFFMIPEGGTNKLAVKGCEEILTEEDREFDFICCPVGTGGTVSGLINASNPSQKVLGFPALKGDFLKAEIKGFVEKPNWELILNYHFGGYAKVDRQLINFINRFSEKYKIQLDPVYTGKMLFGIFDLVEKDYFPKGSRILAIHTGGLQGISGMNAALRKKNMPLIKL